MQCLLPPPLTCGIVYIGDFNARHPELGDKSPTPNRNGPRLLGYIWRNRLTRWDTGGATHSHGGTLDHILTSGLVASRVKCSSVPVLFSDHIALSFHYSLPATSPSSYTRTCTKIPPKYYPTYISFISSLLPTFNLQCPEELYTSLVKSTHDYYTRYITKASYHTSPRDP